jgi:glycosyltransferase involved in cell wall biosynthesis
MPCFLAVADVVVSPRNFGGNLPIKILEYLAAGRAIVATSIPAHQAVLNEETAVLVDPTVAHMATAIINLLDDPARIARLQSAARSYAEQHLGWTEFRESLRELFRRVIAPPAPRPTLVSVIIPAKNAADVIGQMVDMVQSQRCAGVEIETVVVDSGSVDGTVGIAERAGACVVTLPERDGPNPAAARNRGAMVAKGDPIVFLDDDCTPATGWLDALLAAHAAGAACVGGSLALPQRLPASARWDYYCGWYHVHPARKAGEVRHHPPCNLSVRRAAFASTRGFVERQPIAYAHEELAWQAELQRAGHCIYFEPRAVVYHWNRPGLGNLLRRNYRWAYSAIESKAESGVARFNWLYRYPRALITTSFFLAPLQAIYITWCWVRNGVFEPLLALPVLFAARFAYAVGLMAGGIQWLKRRGSAGAPVRPRWE